jgi:hypothetical protein
MREIGLILNLVKSQVSQNHASAVLHLRARLKMPTALKGPQNKPGETALKEHVWEKLGGGSTLIPHDLP